MSVRIMKFEKFEWLGTKWNQLVNENKMQIHFQKGKKISIHHEMCKETRQGERE